MAASNTPGARWIAREFRRRKWPTPGTFLQVGVGVARELKTFTRTWPETKFVGCEPCRHWLKDPWNDVGYPGLLLPVAISDHEGTATFYERRRHRAASSLNKGIFQKNVEYAVPVTTVDKILEKNGPFPEPIFLWLDCEGSELAALAGATTTLSKVRWVNIEVADQSSECEAIAALGGFTLVGHHSASSDKCDLFFARLDP